MRKIELRQFGIWKQLIHSHKACSWLMAMLLPWAATADCIQWIQRTDVGSPGIRSSPTLAFDSVHGVTVMFGGETTNGSGGRINPTDTWEYNGTTWYQVTITYAELWERGLREPAHLPGRNPGGGWFHDFLGNWGDEEMHLWLRYYGSDEERNKHAHEWPKNIIPSKEKPPCNGDRRLPKGPF